MSTSIELHYKDRIGERDLIPSAGILQLAGLVSFMSSEKIVNLPFFDVIRQT